MKNAKVIQDKQRLDSLFKRVKDFSGDIEFQAYWAQFLCVLTSGFIENSIRNLYSEYARDKSSPHVANYVSHELQAFQNAKSEKILQLTGIFSSEWRTTLEVYMEDKRKAAIDSVVNNKNQIAHGRPVSITFTRIYEYYKSSVEVIDFINDSLK